MNCHIKNASFHTSFYFGVSVAASLKVFHVTNFDGCYMDVLSNKNDLILDIKIKL